MLQVRTVHELPEHVGCNFFRSAGVIDNSCDDAGNFRIVQMEQLLHVRTAGRGHNFNERGTFRIHTNKTTTLSEM